VQNPIIKSPLTVISREAVSQFQGNWVTVAELRERYSLKRTRLEGALRKEGVPSIAVSATSLRLYDRVIANQIAERFSESRRR